MADVAERGGKPWVTDHTNWKVARIPHPDDARDVRRILVPSNAAAFEYKRKRAN